MRAGWKYRAWSAGLAAVALGGLIGCSGDGGGGGSAADGEALTPSESKQPPKAVELTFFSGGNLPEETFQELYGNAIRAKYPQFTISYAVKGNVENEDYIARMINEAVDIRFDSIGNIPQGLKYKMDMDMSELVKKHGFDLSHYDEVAVKGITLLADGRMIGLPVSNSSRLLYYNKDLFDRFGVAYPRDGMSWDEVTALSKRMTRMDGGTQYIGASSSKEHHIRMNALSVPLVDPKTGKATIATDERWKTIFKTGFFDLYDDAGYRQVIAKALPNRNAFYGTHTAAMYIYPSFLPANEPKQLEGMNWDMVSEPYYSQQPGVSSQVYPTYFMINTGSKHKDEALLAITALMSKDYQTELARQGQMPVLNDPEVKKQLGQGTPYPEKNWQAVFHNRSADIPYKSPHDYDVEKIYLQEHLQLAKGEVDLNTALRRAEEAANKYLEENAQH